MSTLDDIGRRAARAVREEADAMVGSMVDAMVDAIVDIDDALVAVRAAAAVPVVPATGRWRSVAGLAAALALVVAGASVVTGVDDDQVTDAPAPTDPARGPVPTVGSTTLPSGWSTDPYYLGGGLTLRAAPAGFSESAEADGDLARSSAGQILRRGSMLEAQTYVSTLRAGRRTIVVGLRRGGRPPGLVREAEQRVVVSWGGYTLVVTAGGFADPEVARRVADGLELDTARLLDRFDVDGGFDAVLQRSDGWVLKQGAVGADEHCVRLLVGASAAGQVCVPASSAGSLFLLRSGGRQFVLGLPDDGSQVAGEVLLADGSVVDVMRQGWSGPVLVEVPASVVSLDGRRWVGCPIGELADAVETAGPVAVRVTECRGSRAQVEVLVPRAGVRAVQVVRSDDGRWAAD